MRIVGKRYSIIDKAKELKVKEVIVAMPSVDAKNLKDILNICKQF